MERETELTQSWNPELAALNDKGGLLKGIPLLVGGELKTFSLPAPLDDDGTDISLKDWQLGPRSSLDRETASPYSIKPFKGSVRTRFTPMEPRLDEDLSPRGQSSPDHFETPTTPRTPRTSCSSTRSSSVSPSKSFLQEGDSPQLQHDSTPTNGSESNSSLQSDSDGHHPQHTTPSARSGGIAFDVTLEDQTLTNANADTNNKSARSLRVSFVDDTQTPKRPTPPIVRHRSPLKSRSLHPPKEVKALQPKWESSTKIRHQTSISTPVTKPHVNAPLHGVRRKGTSGAKPRAAVAPLPTPPPEIEIEFQGSSGYLSDGRILGSERHSGMDLRRSLDSQSMGYSRGDFGEYSSNQLSRDLTMSPNRSSREDFSHGRPGSLSPLPRSFGRRQHGDRYEVDDEEAEEDVKVGMLCGGGLSDTKLSGEFVRLLSKLCRVSVPAPKQPISKSVSRGRKFERSTATSLSWDPSTQNATPRESFTVIGRHDSLKLLSERCSNAPTPTYNVHKPRKIRDHEPHIHFYKTISKTLDQKLKS